MAGDDAMLRVSAPRGDFHFLPAVRPVVAMVAGIGVTLALAIVRSIVREGLTEPCHVDVSARREEDFVCAAELRAAAAANERVTVNTRVTSRDGRIRPEEVRALHARFPGAEYFLCGPQLYMDDVSQELRAAGVPPARIRIEHFTPAAGRPARAQATRDSFLSRLSSFFRGTPR